MWNCYYISHLRPVQPYNNNSIWKNTETPSPGPLDIRNWPWSDFTDCTWLWPSLYFQICPVIFTERNLSQNPFSIYGNFFKVDLFPRNLLQKTEKMAKRESSCDANLKRFVSSLSTRDESHWNFQSGEVKTILEKRGQLLVKPRNFFVFLKSNIFMRSTGSDSKFLSFF